MNFRLQVLGSTADSLVSNLGMVGCDGYRVAPSSMTCSIRDGFERYPGLIIWFVITLLQGSLASAVGDQRWPRMHIVVIEQVRISSRKVPATSSSAAEPRPHQRAS